MKVGIIVSNLPKLSFLESKTTSSLIKAGYDVTLIKGVNSNKITFNDFVLQIILKFQLYLLKGFKNNFIISQTPMNGLNFIDEIKEIESNSFDYIINYSDLSCNKQYLKFSKNGVYYFLHDNKNISTNRPFGINEINNNLDSIDVFLVNNSSSNVIEVKEKCKYYFEYVIARNVLLIEAKLPEILIKFFNNNKHTDGEYFAPKSSKISLLTILFYCLNFVKKSSISFLDSLRIKFFGKSADNWFLSTGIIENNNFITKANHKPSRKDEFWADPFLFKHNDKDYVFFEKYNNDFKRGIISCGELINNSLENIVDVLVKDYHLSYPNLFMEDGDIFMIPETSANKRLEIYKCEKFPDKWELYSHAFEGESIVDTNYFIDEFEDKWLFLSKSDNVYDRNLSELYLYKIDGLKLNEITPHKKNPVLVNCSKARNGGGIIKIDNSFYRPSQNNTKSTYGLCLNLNKINELSVNGYKELCDSSFDKFTSNLERIHHISVQGSKFVIDRY
jgi:hypothetical protein